MAELLSMKELEKTFIMHYLHGEHVVGCKNISFDLNEGEFIGITGKSGAGKSTVLKTIYRTYLPTGGKLIFHSDQYGPIDLVTATEREMISLRKKEIGYVSQFLNVMPRVTALEIVMDAILEMGVSAYEAEEKAKDMLAHFRLPESLWDSFPKTFSGGEKLRLNLAQAMVKKPKLLLLDEPTASLDEASKRSVKEMIEQLKQSGTSMIGIFHDLEFMESVVDSHYHLENGVLNKKMAV